MEIAVIVVKQFSTRRQMNLIVYPRTGVARNPRPDVCWRQIRCPHTREGSGSHGAHVGGSDVGQKSSPKHGDGKVYSLKVAKQILIQLPWPTTFFRIDPISRGFKCAAP